MYNLPQRISSSFILNMFFSVAEWGMGESVTHFYGTADGTTVWYRLSVPFKQTPPKFEKLPRHSIIRRTGHCNYNAPKETLIQLFLWKFKAMVPTVPQLIRYIGEELIYMYLRVAVPWYRTTWLGANDQQRNQFWSHVRPLVPAFILCGNPWKERPM